MKRVTPTRLFTVLVVKVDPDKVMDYLRRFHPDAPVVVESSVVYPESYEGDHTDRETDSLDLHRVVGMYNAKDTPIQRSGVVLCIYRNASCQEVDNEIVEDVDD